MEEMTLEKFLDHCNSEQRIFHEQREQQLRVMEEEMISQQEQQLRVMEEEMISQQEQERTLRQEQEAHDKEVAEEWDKQHKINCDLEKCGKVAQSLQMIGLLYSGLCEVAKDQHNSLEVRKAACTMMKTAMRFKTDDLGDLVNMLDFSYRTMDALGVDLKTKIQTVIQINRELPDPC